MALFPNLSSCFRVPIYTILKLTGIPIPVILFKMPQPIKLNDLANECGQHVYKTLVPDWNVRGVQRGKLKIYKEQGRKLVIYFSKTGCGQLFGAKSFDEALSFINIIETSCFLLSL